MAQKYVVTGQLSVVYPEFENPADRAEFLNGLKFVPNDHIPELYFREYSADTIADKATAILLRQYPLVARAAFMSRNWNDSCKISGHDELASQVLDENILHPSNDFRANDAVFSNADLREALGCADHTPTTSCSFL